MQEYYIGADMGTTNLKVCIYDENAVELASASRRCDTQYTDIGGALQSPEQWWSNFVSALTELRQHTTGMQCRSICISSHVPALIALAEDGSVLYPAMIWQDYSGVRRLRSWKQTIRPYCGATTRPKSSHITLSPSCSGLCAMSRNCIKRPGSSYSPRTT